MSTLRLHIEKRNFFVLALVALLCITTLVYAAAPLMILGVPFAKWLILTVNGYLAYLTIKAEIKEYIKDLDEKIADLEDEVRALEKKRDDVEKDYNRRNGYYKKFESKLKAAETALTGAKQAVIDAESAVTKAKHKHIITKEDTRLKYNEYAHHVRYCDWCNGSALCSEGSRLHSEWQQWESKTAEAYKAISTAEEAVKTKEEAVKDAKSVVSYTTRMKSFWKSLKDKSKAKLDTTQNKLDTKVSELSSKEFERDLQDALLENTKGNIAEAKKQLEAVKAKYPDEWEKEMAANPDLAAKIEDILNTEEESNEDPNNLP